MRLVRQTKHLFLALPWMVCFVFGGVAQDQSDNRDFLAGIQPDYRIVSPTNHGWTNHITFNKAGRYLIEARWRFPADLYPLFQAFQLRKPPEIGKWSLNSTPLTLPMQGMRYSILPGISPTLLGAGTNLLAATWEIEVRTSNGKLRPDHVSVSAQLQGLMAEELTFQTLPVVGAVSVQSVSISCRVNMPAEVTLRLDGGKQVSPPGLIHVFRVQGLRPDTVYPYRLSASLDDGKILKEIGPYEVRTVPDGSDLKFVAMGDARGNPKDWATVAAAVLKAKPALVLFSGDMVYDGRLDEIWDRNFFGQAPEYFASIPTLIVHGNHENDSPMLNDFFVTPAPQAHFWSQVAGPALLVGIDGTQRWDDQSENYRWLENTLAASRQKFIFLVTHYPAWTSGPHGRLNAAGRPEHAIYEGQKFLMPLLKKYQATAMIAGHDHCYNRSEPPDGVTVVVSGGAGAPLYDVSKTAQTQNPYSKVFKKEFNFCLFAIKGDTCQMRALTPGGEQLDERTWPARELPRIEVK